MMKPRKYTPKRYIVCVDDDRALLDGLIHQLEGAFAATHEIEGAESAQEAIELLDELHASGHLVEMVISDQVMPGMKGDKLLELLHKEYPEMVTVMLTGQAGLDSAIYAINNAGLSKYLMKPWHDAEFLLTIRDLLENYRLSQENKRLFQELKEAYHHLKETQEQLIHSEKLAVVGKVTASIAHEIRNQLTILGYAEVIRMAVPDNKQVSQYVQSILDTRNRILSIVDEIRQFAKNQTQSYEMEPALLAEIVTTTLNIMNYDQEAKKRHLIKDVQASPVVVVNRDKIIQVLINLIRNAVDATPEGGQITVTLTRQADWTVMTVADTGCGVPEDLLETIWQPFFTTKGEHGTGLGLDICKRIIEGHHGAISCASQIGVGTTFTIRLPLERRDSALAQ